MVCPSRRGDNPRALASGLSSVQVDKKDSNLASELYSVHTNKPWYIEDIQIFGLNVLFLSSSEAKNAYSMRARLNKCQIHDKKIVFSFYFSQI